MNIKSIFVNLPITDLERTKTFWTALGFSFNAKFTNDKALALILREGSIYVMLLKMEFFKTFTNRPVSDGPTTQVLNAIEVERKESVDELVKKALENGGSKYGEPQDHGWMYQNSFTDVDGHQWEVFWSDESQLPGASNS